MKPVIHKFKLVPGRNRIPVPGLSPRPLSVGAQGDDVVVWAIVDSESPDGMLSELSIDTVFTGGEAPVGNRMRFLGTVQRTDGIVVHAFWRMPG